jgi:arsenate reductase
MIVLSHYVAVAPGAQIVNQLFVPTPGSQGTAMPLTMYGIKNCDTIKKARVWLDEHGQPYAFHDYKTAGIDAATLEAWTDELGWEPLLNRAGTSFRALPDADKADIDRAKAIRLMLANPSMIKRPVLDTGRTRIVGFKPDLYQAAFG